MPEFNLKPEQVGELNPDGTIAKHPELDILGSPYEARNATRKYLRHNGKRVFVVIPPGKDSEDNKYNLPGAVSQDAAQGFTPASGRAAPKSED
jgi:hypothetical protein